MAIAFSYYARAMNNICLASYALSPEYVVQLNMVRRAVAARYPELTTSIAAQERFSYLCPDAIPTDSLRERRYEFAYVKEFRPVPGGHPVLDFIRGADLTFTPAELPERGNLCLICPDAATPARHMTATQLDAARKHVMCRGFRVMVVGSDVHPGFHDVDIVVTGQGKLDLLAMAGWVVAAENEYAFLAAGAGLRTTLVAGGPGAELYRELIPGGEVNEF